MNKTESGNTILNELLFKGHVARTCGEWWCVKDVCYILGLTHTYMATNSLEESDLTEIVIRSGGQSREMLFVNEAGLYQLIFQSRKPEAREFRRWVTSEVLPQIRKQGFYVAHGMNPKLVQVRTGRALLAEAARLRDEAEALEEQAKELLTLDGALTVREALEETGMPYSVADLLKAAGKMARTAKENGIPIGQKGKTKTYPREDIVHALELNQTRLFTTN